MLIYYLERLFNLKDGSVMDFSKSTLQEFVVDSVGLDILDEKYLEDTGSKAKRLKKFIRIEKPGIVYKLVADLLEYYKERHFDESEESKKYLIGAWNELEKLKQNTETLSEISFSKNPDEATTVLELQEIIDDAIEKGKYNLVIDRLHTYCTKFFKKICNEDGLDTEQKPLHSLAGEYLKLKNLDYSETTLTLIKSSISVLERFNNTRNNESLAHDNDLINNSEAQLITRWIIAILNFIEDLRNKQKI